MMADNSNTCTSCGSLLPDGMTVCDICGHDSRDDARSRRQSETAAESAAGQPEAAPGTQKQGTEAARPKQKPSAAKGPKKSGGKSGAAQTSDALFNTPQWLAIVVAAFILGGVVGASFLPAGGGAKEAADSAGNVQGQQTPQADLARLDATREAAEANPDSPDALLAYAHALHDSGMPEQAIVQYKRYLEFVPDNPDARVDLGICYFETKDYATAIAEMEQAVAGHPDHQLGNYNLGIVNLNAGNKDKAREWFEKARDIDPASPHGQNASQLLEQHF